VMAQMNQMEDEIKNSIEAPVMQKPPITPAAAGAAKQLVQEEATSEEVAEKTASSTQTDSPKTAITGGDAEHHSPKTSS
jgi:hypothetical protein